MIKTRLCDLLGIEYPVLQGGMAWVADASLASAVSNAGGPGHHRGHERGRGVACSRRFSRSGE